MKRPLVAYSGSSSEEEAPPKKRRLPALSAAVVVPTPVDDPSRHQGRTRSAPHVDGQWAAHVYIALPLRATALSRLVRTAFATAHDLEPALHAVGGLSELHVSLTPPVFLRAHQREEVKLAVKRAARESKTFAVSFACFAQLTNDERTRTFVCMEVGAGHRELKTLSDALTAPLRQFRQKTYYDAPRFHASFAWALLDLPAAAPESCARVKDLPDGLLASLNKELGRDLSSPAACFDVGEVRIRIGKDVSVYRLNGRG